LFEVATQGFKVSQSGLLLSRSSPNPPGAQVSTLGEHQVQGREDAPPGGPPPFWPHAKRPGKVEKGYTNGMFDAHVHLDRLTDPPQALARARKAGVVHFLLPSVGPETWSAQQRLAQANDDVHTAYGLHPWYAARLSSEERIRDLGALRAIVKKNKPIALGEMGLDHHPHFAASTHDAQEKAFAAQLALAHLFNLPVVLHVVRAHGACLSLLRDMGVPAAGGMVHSFSGSKESALAYVALGLHISFSGGVTRPHTKKTREAAAAIPLNRLLVETDAPDQTPFGRTASENEPAFLLDIVQCLAELRQQSPVDVAAQTEQNARTLFRI
jgi:TatD DNase family protein